MNKSWRRKISETFMFGKVLRVFRFDDLLKIARTVKPGISNALVEQYLDEMDGLLFKKAPNGLILNSAVFPPVTIGDAVSVLIDGAVVSLHTVLGDRGVLNNYTKNMFCVRPRSISSEVVVAEYDGGSIKCFPVDDKLFSIGEYQDRLDRTYLYPRATVEAAIVHWFWLIKHEVGPFRSMDTQVDLEDVDLECVYMMAEPFGLVDDIKEWVRRAKEREDYDDNERWRDPPAPVGPKR